MGSKHSTLSTVNILAHGDSITKGYYKKGYAYHPYTIRLNALLTDRFPSAEFTITNDGVNGEKTQEMLKRLKARFEQDGNQSFDFIVIMGGLNDLAFPNISVEQIASNLKAMYDLAVQHATVCCIAVTVPTCLPDHNKTVREKKDLVNQMIADYVQQKGDDKLQLVDLALADNGLHFFSMTSEEQELLYDDPIHFSPAGYDRLGEAIFAGMKNKLRALKL